MGKTTSKQFAERDHLKGVNQRTSPRKNIAVAMSAEDWSEIYYALETKKGLIEDGVYKSEEDAVWAAHLQEIVDKIGPDGQDAFDNGIIAV